VVGYIKPPVKLVQKPLCLHDKSPKSFTHSRVAV